MDPIIIIIIIIIIITDNLAYVDTALFYSKWHIQ